MSLKNEFIAGLVPANTSVQFLEESDRELIELLEQKEISVVTENGDFLVIGAKSADELKAVIAENEALLKSVQYAVVQPVGDLLELRKSIGKLGFEILRNDMVTNVDGYEFLVLFSAKMTRSEYGNHFADNLEDETTSQEDKDFNKLIDLLFGWEIVLADPDAYDYIEKAEAGWKAEREAIEKSENPDTGALEVLDAKLAAADYAKKMSTTANNDFSGQMLSELNVGDNDLSSLMDSFASLQASLEMFSLQIDDALNQSEAEATDVVDGENAVQEDTTSEGED